MSRWRWAMICSCKLTRHRACITLKEWSIHVKHARKVACKACPSRDVYFICKVVGTKPSHLRLFSHALQQVVARRSLACFTEQRLVRSVAIDDVESCFYQTLQRTVDLTFSDVTLESRWYRVDPKFRGMKVQVLWNLQQCGHRLLIASHGSAHSTH